MKIFKGIMLFTFITVFVAGCASQLIDVRQGSDKISLKEESQVANCESKGKINVSVIDKVGIFNRSIDDVDANLLQLAKNGAVDSGGDTVVKGDRPEIGKRTFLIYKCQP